MSCDLIAWRRPCPGWNIHCYHHCHHYLFHPQHHHHSISTFSVWDSFETFQFYLDKKDEVERMTLEDFVKSVVSHAEVNLLPPKRWKIVIGNSDSDRNGDGDGDGPKSWSHCRAQWDLSCQTCTAWSFQSTNSLEASSPSLDHSSRWLRMIKGQWLIMILSHKRWRWWQSMNSLRFNS